MKESRRIERFLKITNECFIRLRLRLFDFDFRSNVQLPGPDSIEDLVECQFLLVNDVQQVEGKVKRVSRNIMIPVLHFTFKKSLVSAFMNFLLIQIPVCNIH